MNNNLGMCMYCMSPLEEGEEKCPSCGEPVDVQNSPDYLPTGYTYENRFLFGRVLKTTGESVCYIGYDTSQDCRVLLKEFAPMSLCSRKQSTNELVPEYGSEVKFKALRADFKELAIELMEAELDGTIPIISVYEANNTVYTVYKFFNVVTFSRYLQHKGGDISWGEAKKLILPIINTVSALHERGIMHRGISPETLVVDVNRKMYLTGFMSASARSAGGEIPYELFDGYSAPEQYERGGWQNRGTDIYSICAVIYRAVTGAKPIDIYALNRGEAQIPAVEITFRVPNFVSKALAEGMEVDLKNRIDCTSQLTRKLLQEEESNTAVFTRQIPILTKKNIEGIVKEKQYTPESENEKTQAIQAINIKKPKKKGTVKRIVISAIATILTFVIVGSVAYFYYNKKLEEERNKLIVSPVPETLLLENFVGQKYSLISAKDKLDHWYNFKVKEVYSDAVSKGTVISQFPPHATKMMEGRTVLLTVSKGSDKIEMPDLIDSDIMEAVRLVAMIGAEAEFSFVEVEDEPLDVVLKTEPEPGTKFNPETQRIVIYLSEDSNFKEEVMEVQNPVTDEPKE